MTSNYKYSVTFSLFLFICSWLHYLALEVPGFANEPIFAVEFDVIPGGQTLNFENEWDGITCKFTYITQGGTKEKWVMSLTTDDDRSHIMCTVMRPEGVSYLMFQTFKLEIVGNFNSLKEEVLDSSGKLLQVGEYKKEKLSISDDAKFQRALGKVSIYGGIGKREL